ncbi:MAG: hypothetical protein EBZ91_10135 [Gammaproteobacteria bacterium]|nr:hypothetical protein [Gammaproteobacteria bacterium]
MALEAELQKTKNELAEVRRELDEARVEITDLETEIETTWSEKKTLEDRVLELENAEGEREEAVENLNVDLEKERALNEAAVTLVRALDTFLSWLDNPPPGMSVASQAAYLANFRRDLDDARRKVSL